MIKPEDGTGEEMREGKAQQDMVPASVSQDESSGQGPACVPYPGLVPEGGDVVNEPEDGADALGIGGEETGPAQGHDNQVRFASEDIRLRYRGAKNPAPAPACGIAQGRPCGSRGTRGGAGAGLNPGQASQLGGRGSGHGGQGGPRGNGPRQTIPGTRTLRDATAGKHRKSLADWLGLLAAKAALSPVQVEKSAKTAEKVGSDPGPPGFHLETW